MAEKREWNAPPVEGEGPWLIRSHYWNSWHCRRADGGAGGYSQDIVRAGVFDHAKAREYHDEPGGRDEAVPVSQVIDQLEARLTDLTAERDALASVVDGFRRKELSDHV